MEDHCPLLSREHTWPPVEFLLVLARRRAVRAGRNSCGREFFEFSVVLGDHITGGRGRCSTNVLRGVLRASRGQSWEADVVLEKLFRGWNDCRIRLESRKTCKCDCEMLGVAVSRVETWVSLSRECTGDPARMCVCVVDRRPFRRCAVCGVVAIDENGGYCLCLLSCRDQLYVDVFGGSRFSLPHFRLSLSRL